ncbi:MAG: hypothetical protein Q9M91_05960 [Candidatus Dojkabacteria bacterium]|nr:hypothetical protein [Candidatus Dojkabacteria bacterium]MDQ7021344.1 hypothetical protein [Candidatus Dojkabacteria bacterium]
MKNSDNQSEIEKILEPDEASPTELDARINDLEEKIEKLGLLSRYSTLQRQWDKSLVKLLTMIVTTYIFVAVVMYFSDVSDFLFAALIPALTFVASTAALPFVKRFWVKRYVKAEKESAKIT